MYNVLGDPSKPRAWSKYATDSSYNKDKDNSDEKSKGETADVKEGSNVKSSKTDKKEKKKTDKENDEVKQALKKVGLLKEEAKFPCLVFVSCLIYDLFANESEFVLFTSLLLNLYFKFSIRMILCSWNFSKVTLART